MRKLILLPVFLLFVLTGSAQTAEEYYKMGKEEPDNNKRVNLFTKAIEAGKDDAWPYYRRAWAYYNLRRYDRALQDFKTSIEKPGTLDDTYNFSGLAWVYYDLGKYDKAREYVDKSHTSSNNKNSGAWSVDGWLCINNKNYPGAVKAFSAYIGLNPESYLGYWDRSYTYLLMEDYQKVFDDCVKGLSYQANHEGMIERKALAMLKLGREEEAISLIEEKIDYKPDDPISLSRIGNLFYRARDYKGAIEYHDKGIDLYQRKIEDDPEVIKVYNDDIYLIYMSRGDAYEALEDYPHALQDYEKATLTNNKRHEAWIEIGELQTFQSNYREAINAYEKAFDRKPTHNVGWVNLGFCYSNIKEERKAIQAYTRGLKVDPQNGLLFNNRGFAHLELKEYNDAKSDLEKAIQVDPKIVMSHVSLSEYYYAVKEYDNAIKKANEAMAMEGGTNSAYTAAHQNRGLCYMAQEKWELAISDFEKVVMLDPGHIKGHEGLGISYFKNEEFCGAYKNLKKALSLDKNNREKECKDAPLYLAKITKNPCH